MRLYVVSNMTSLAYKARPSKFWYFLWYTIFNDEPVIGTRYNCLLFFISVSDYVDSGGGIDGLIVELKVEVILTLNFRLVFGLKPLHQ